MSNTWAKVMPEGDNVEKIIVFIYFLSLIFSSLWHELFSVQYCFYSSIQENLPQISGTANKKTTYDLLLSKGVSVSIFGLCYFEGLPAYCPLIASNCFFIQFVTRFLDVQCCTLSSSWIRHFNTQLYLRAPAYSTLIGSLWACQSRYLGLSVLPPALIIKLTNWRQFFKRLSCYWSK